MDPSNSRRSQTDFRRPVSADTRNSSGMIASAGERHQVLQEPYVRNRGLRNEHFREHLTQPGLQNSAPLQSANSHQYQSMTQSSGQSPLASQYSTSIPRFADPGSPSGQPRSSRLQSSSKHPSSSQPPLGHSSSSSSSSNYPPSSHSSQHQSQPISHNNRGFNPSSQHQPVATTNSSQSLWVFSSGREDFANVLQTASAPHGSQATQTQPPVPHARPRIRQSPSGTNLGALAELADADEDPSGNESVRLPPSQPQQFSSRPQAYLPSSSASETENSMSTTSGSSIDPFQHHPPSNQLASQDVLSDASNLSVRRPPKTDTIHQNVAGTFENESRSEGQAESQPEFMGGESSGRSLSDLPASSSTSRPMAQHRQRPPPPAATAASNHSGGRRNYSSDPDTSEMGTRTPPLRHQPQHLPDASAQQFHRQLQQPQLQPQSTHHQPNSNSRPEQHQPYNLNSRPPDRTSGQQYPHISNVAGHTHPHSDEYLQHELPRTSAEATVYVDPVPPGRPHGDEAGGYDVFFIDPLRDAHQCPICSMALKTPVQTSCGHRFCKTCIDPIIADVENAQCPVDHEPVDKTFADKCCEREVLSLGVRCNNYLNGCVWCGPLKDLPDHMGVCRYNLVRCPNRGCEGQPMFQCDLHRHINEECLYRPVPCRLCRMNVAQALMHDHLSQDCMDYEIQCPNGCGNSVKRRDLERHTAQDCSHIVCTCPYQRYSCPFKATREEMNQHCQDNQEQHLDMVAKQTQSLEGTMDKMRNSLSLQQQTISLLEEKLQEEQAERKRLAEMQKSSASLDPAALMADSRFQAALKAFLGDQFESRMETKAVDIRKSVDLCEQRSIQAQEGCQLLKGQIHESEKTLGQMTVTAARSDAALAEVDLRLLAVETNSHNGLIIFK
eukprot:scpid31318/ scgid5718/ TNF receptor-associated factor 3; CAP-1; CD40 receptor-associated factor 1; CD40-binding protein; LMP1-associated protein 1